MPTAPSHRSPHLISSRKPHLGQARASTLNRLHLRLAVHRPPKPLGQLVAVPELAVLRLHTAQLPRRAAANSAKSLGRSLRSCAVAAAVVAHHGAVLAGFLAVGGEGLGERLGGGGGVDLGGVVDFFGVRVSGWFWLWDWEVDWGAYAWGLSGGRGT